MNANEVSWVYNTLFSIPGMNEPVKIDGKVSRNVVLLFCNIVEAGLAKTGTSETGSLAELASKESIDELKQFMADCLQKAGLTELSEQMKKIPAKKES